MSAVLGAALLAGSVLLQVDVDRPPAEPEEQPVSDELREEVAEPTVLRTLVVRASAYTCYESCRGSGRTRTGTIPHWGTVSVDPSVIPLGSRLLIQGFGDQVFVAEDTGGAVRGNRVDIFFLNYQEAIRFGVQTREVTVLR